MFLSLVRTQASIGPWYFLGWFQEPEITTSSEIPPVSPCLTFLQKLGPPGLWSLPLGRQLSPLTLTAVELQILGSKVTHCGEKLALVVPLFLHKSYPPDWLGPWTATNPIFAWWCRGLHSWRQGHPLRAVSSPFEHHFSALKSAVSSFFTRISAFLPLGSASMFLTSCFNLVATFWPSNSSSFTTRSWQWGQHQWRRTRPCCPLLQPAGSVCRPATLYLILLAIQFHGFSAGATFSAMRSTFAAESSTLSLPLSARRSVKKSITTLASAAARSLESRDDGSGRRAWKIWSAE